MIELGSLRIAGGAALAPMAGVTDAAMRLLCAECGAAWSVSEMLSAKGWIWSQGKNRNAQELLFRFEGEGIAGLQLFGSEPALVAQAAEMLEDRSFDFIDLNFGCPAPKITGNGEGSALLRTPERVGQIVRETVRHTRKPVTAKIRAGWDEHSVNAVEIARICEASGAAAVAVHARTRMQQYSGKADWSVIRAVKQNVGIPVFGNGDIRSGADALRMVEETRCDAVLVARAAEGNPWIFSEINAALRGDAWTPPTAKERLIMALRHFDLEEKLHGEKGGMLEMRKHIAWYISGMRGAARLREEINRIGDADTVRATLKRCMDEAEEDIIS